MKSHLAECKTSITPEDVAILRSTRGTFLLSWSAVKPVHVNGNIKGYEIYYERKTDRNITKIIKVEITGLEVEYSIATVTRGETYNVKVIHDSSFLTCKMSR